jgi:hypothetical protein
LYFFGFPVAKGNKEVLERMAAPLAIESYLRIILITPVGWGGSSPCSWPLVRLSPEPVLFKIYEDDVSACLAKFS